MDTKPRAASPSPPIDARHGVGDPAAPGRWRPGPPAVPEPELEIQGRRLGGVGWRFCLLALVVAVPGILLIVLAGGWERAAGIVILALSGPLALVAAGLLLSSLVARWSARHRPFA